MHVESTGPNLLGLQLRGLGRPSPARGSARRRWRQGPRPATKFLGRRSTGAAGAGAGDAGHGTPATARSTAAASRKPPALPRTAVPSAGMASGHVEHADDPRGNRSFGRWGWRVGATSAWPGDRPSRWTNRPSRWMTRTGRGTWSRCVGRDAGGEWAIVALPEHGSSLRPERRRPDGSRRRRVGRP
jgi:hypothetical protein